MTEISLTHEYFLGWFAKKVCVIRSYIIYYMVVKTDIREDQQTESNLTQSPSFF
jgi:hypothetical protein